MSDALADILRRIDDWGADHAAVAVVGPHGIVAGHGDLTHPFRWASVTKPVTAWAVLAAADAGLVDLDEAAGPPGATVRHLLAHASGLAFEGDQVQGVPGRRRIYSNGGFDRLGALVAERAGSPFADVLRRSVLAPLAMDGTALVDRPSQGLAGTGADLAAFAGELLRPTLLAAPTATAARTVAYPGIKGLVPGIGTFDPCDWGLGLEIHDGKRPHWMGERLSPAAVGHFGRAGTFLWMDPAIDHALVLLTDREFGTWAREAWPVFSDAVVEAIDR